jgi:hypothetical protein
MITSQLLGHRSAIDAELFAIALCNRFVIAAQFMRNRCAIDAQSMRNHCGIDA